MNAALEEEKDYLEDLKEEDLKGVFYLAIEPWEEGEGSKIFEEDEEEEKRKKRISDKIFEENRDKNIKKRNKREKKEKDSFGKKTKAKERDSMATS